MGSSEASGAIEGMILSASGWRGVFAADGDGESRRPDISPGRALAASGAALVFHEFLASAGREGAVIVGTDTRPTGRAIADAVIRALLALGRDVLFAGVAAAPEIMAFARQCGAARTAAGFVYVSASHNPVGHNGLKFGLTSGGVLQGEEAAALTGRFTALFAEPSGTERAARLSGAADEARLAAVYAGEAAVKREALAAYRAFTEEVIAGSGDREKAGAVFAALRRGLAERPLAVCADFNGSARTLSIDRDFLGGLGAAFHGIHEEPGDIAHAIVPEGDSLEDCRRFVEEVHREDGVPALGYVPDCDGDRGNLVFWDEAAGEGRALEAQEVFALSCVAELAWLVWSGEPGGAGAPLTNAAVVVNDPTSLRIERVAEAFGAQVFRAEVGEANAVGLAARLRERGYLVRVFGEGSAGGVIIHPSAVRDPLDTLGAILKLLTIRTGARAHSANANDNRPGLFEIWLRFSGQSGAYRDDFTLADVTASLPAFATTGAYSPEAKLQVRTRDHRLLKERYQRVFLREWERRRDSLASRYGITAWEASGYNGTEERRGVSRFGEAGKGGLKIVFRNKRGRAAASIWMRGSGTEPVFRVMADAEGADNRLERELIEWQRRMVLEADEAAGG
ncbi:MAG: phosphohexose mutase family protein [Treponematales bacterium]